MKILFIGDIVGEPGRRAVKTLLPQLREQHSLDFVIANGENSAGGAGCNWHDKSYAASVAVSVVPPNYFPEPDGVKGFMRAGAWGIAHRNAVSAHEGSSTGLSR